MNKTSSLLVQKLVDKKIILIGYGFKQEFFIRMLQDFQLKQMYILSDVEKILNIIQEEREKANDKEWCFLLWLPEKTDKALLIMKYFIKQKISNYLFVSPQDYKILYHRYFMKYLKEKHVDVNTKIIQIDNFRFENFFCCKVGEVNLGDSILPSLMNDFSLVKEGPFEYGEVSLEAGDIVLDCGANIGFFSAIALAKGCQVHAFEPTPETCAVLKRNLNLAFNKQYYVSNCGIYNKECLAKFFLHSDAAENSLIFERGTEHIAYFPVTTIDEYVKKNRIERVDFIKADIEGAERYMLEGACDTIRRFKPKLSICTYHHNDDPIILEEKIKKIEKNYIIEHRWKKLYAYVPKNR